MGETLGERNPKFIQHLHEVDRLYIAGQAKSHCVEWTIPTCSMISAHGGA
jgi:nicotinamidase-related amidase